MRQLGEPWEPHLRGPGPQASTGLRDQAFEPESWGTVLLLSLHPGDKLSAPRLPPESAPAWALSDEEGFPGV